MPINNIRIVGSQTKSFVRMACFLGFYLILGIVGGCSRETRLSSTSSTTVPTLPSHRVLRITGLAEAPLKYLDDTGQPLGIDIEIVSQIFTRLNVPINITLTDSSKRLLALWEEVPASYDLFLTLSKTPEREKYLLYPSESHISIPWNFFVRRDRQNAIRWLGTMESLTPYTIGITEGMTYTPAFNQAVDSGFLTVDPAPLQRLQMPKLLGRRIDMVPLNTLVALYEARLEGHEDDIAYLNPPLKNQSYYNAFSRASSYPGLEDLIRRYDQELARMKAKGEVLAIIQSYLPNYR